MLTDILPDLPYRPLKRLVRTIRIRYATIPWPDRPAIVVDVPADELERQLRDSGWEGMLLSYHYEGEELNLRRPAGVDPETDMQLEDHVRGRPTEDGLELIAHREASRYEHKTAHIDPDTPPTPRWLNPHELDAVLFDDPP